MSTELGWTIFGVVFAIAFFATVPDCSRRQTVEVGLFRTECVRVTQKPLECKEASE